jgi:hypothetical protein
MKKPIISGVLTAIALCVIAQAQPAAPQSNASLPKAPDAGATAWSAGDFAYDGAGNIVAMELRTYTYDALGRLTGFNPVGTALSSQAFSYDVYGNQTSYTTGGLTTTIAVDAATNHLTGSAVAYDAAGNVTQWQPSDLSSPISYGYDPFNMITTVNSGSQRARYIYTADGERLRLDSAPNTANAVTHWTLRDFDGKALRDLQMQGSTWSLSRDYVYRGSLLLAGITPTRVENDSLDHLGAPRLVTDQTGAKIGYHEYYPFGIEATPAGTVSEGSPGHFAGHERDADLSDPARGRPDLHAR